MPTSWVIWVEVYGWFAVLVLASYIFADRDNMLTVAQMQSKGAGFQKGIPLLGHWAAAYLDFILPILLATLVAKYGAGWGLKQIAVIGIIALVFSAVMHWTYIQGGLKFPEAQTYGGHLTPAGWEHVVYMGAAFAIIGLFYLATPHPDPFWVYLTAAWLWVHVVIGVHAPMKLSGATWFPYHGVLDVGTLAPVGGVAAILAGFSWWALR
ncbi:hypothetical protein HYS79_01395 [Patescibacteria group bacterium]|nr:hypothetical protein [Patescibacteria group bacterium]